MRLHTALQTALQVALYKATHSFRCSFTSGSIGSIHSIAYIYIHKHETTRGYMRLHLRRAEQL